MKATDLIPRDYGHSTFQWGPHLQLPGQGKYKHTALQTEPPSGSCVQGWRDLVAILKDVVLEEYLAAI